VKDEEDRANRMFQNTQKRVYVGRERERVLAGGQVCAGERGKPTADEILMLLRRRSLPLSSAFRRSTLALDG